jgi:hypothetical protein
MLLLVIDDLQSSEWTISRILVSSSYSLPAGLSFCRSTTMHTHLEGWKTVFWSRMCAITLGLMCVRLSTCVLGLPLALVGREPYSTMVVAARYDSRTMTGLAGNSGDAFSNKIERLGRMPDRMSGKRPSGGARSDCRSYHSCTVPSMVSRRTERLSFERLTGPCMGSADRNKASAGHRDAPVLRPFGQLVGEVRTLRIA